MYTAEELIEYFMNNCGVKKTRKRAYIDKRNYVLAVLYDVFKYTEEELAIIFNMDRTSVCVARKHAYVYIYKHKNEMYLDNIREYIDKFPAKLKDSKLPEEREVRSIYMKGLDKDVFDELNIRAQMLNIRIDTFAKRELSKLVRSWKK